MDNTKRITKHLVHNILCFIFCINLIQCQKMDEKNLEFHVEISQPGNKYEIPRCAKSPDFALKLFLLIIITILPKLIRFCHINDWVIS